MSDLAAVSAEIAPYLALAANSLGASVIAAAQQRIAEHTVTAGEGFFRRLLRRDDGTVGGIGEDTAQPLDAARADALDARLAALNDQERRLLAAAVSDWLRGRAEERDAPALLDHLTRHAASAGVRIVYNSPTATGQGSIAAGEIRGNVYMGGSGHDQDGS
ncbi:peptide synthetase [Streptomyces sp. NBRC 110611]|uniref:hypothetical protein n=1 Tax=Streptomyces sp. NBRC 110611 TaxID=1621259 RepID=UPI000835A496|nr:hypothetical protein [Streptomyces sp. NBRC 110611]GAU69408.1 peptide synthetase [Streptomyces sp. NBRC 110611]